jgi:hypothetical protein
MKLLTPAEVAENTTSALKDALNDEVIGKVNDLLIEQNFKYNIGEIGSNATIGESDVGREVSLRLLSAHLTNAGWKNVLHYDQRDGEWLTVELVKVK